MADLKQRPVVDCEKNDVNMQNEKLNFRHYFKRKSNYKLFFLSLAYVCFVGLTLVHRAYSAYRELEEPGLNPAVANTGRFRRDVTVYDDNFTSGNFTSGKSDLGAEDDDCYPRSAEEFPGNFLTREETRDGGVFAHILIILYLFGALAIVCDDYFCASLEIICDELKLKEDVAGATFMAAGSSAPEFFTAVIVKVGCSSPSIGG